MQKFFPAANNPATVQAVSKEVKAAIQRRQPVLIVEYDPSEVGPTHDCILELVSRYARALRITKHAADGSHQLLDVCILNNLPHSRLRVVGVNSDACVLETIEGYISLVPDCTITVVRPACNCLTGDTNDVWTDDFPKLSNNVTVLSAAAGTN